MQVLALVGQEEEGNRGWESPDRCEASWWVPCLSQSSLEACSSISHHSNTF